MTRPLSIVPIAAFALATACHAAGADPCQLQRLVAPEPFEPLFFGDAVAHWSDYWFVADPQAASLWPGPTFGCSAGAVYVYQLVGGKLEYRQTLLSSFQQLGDNYGRSIDADDGRLIVGSTFGGFPGRADRPGAVYVYELEDGVWQESAVIEPLAEADDFGQTVAFHDGLLAVSDNYNDRLDRLPRVLVYESIGSAWELRDIVLRPDDVSENSWFGIALALDGERLVVGAPYDRSVLANGGSTHIYTRMADGTYEFDQSLRVDGAERIGWSVALDGPHVLTSAPLATRDFENQGVVYRYTLDGSQCVMSAEIRSAQPGRRHDFGSTLVRHDDRLIVTSGRDFRGSVNAFERSPEGDWRSLARIVPDTTTFALRFGWAMATDGRFLLVGTPEERDMAPDDTYGATYLFDLDCLGCAPDLDADGELTIFDFLTFANLFDAGDPTADLDADGEFTILDFLAFQAAFDTGCE